MRLVIQRVSHARVTVHGEVKGAIGPGLLILLGIETTDTEADAEWLSAKSINVRIFEDDQGVMNCSLLDKGYDILLISQFTLHASTKKGNRPSYIRAARPEQAVVLYEYMIAALEKGLGRPLQTGVFGADMQVELLNDGPVTIWMDSKQKE
jgi:D-tyrosyl-tRNA(Tyr) deacylase